MSRPEDTLPPDLYYNDRTSLSYTTSSRILSIQRSMTNRALSLLSLTTPSLILDVGCGSGLSGEILSTLPASEGGPHTWIGMDISPSMLDIALQRPTCDGGDFLLSDIGQGIPFRAGTFDAAISISAIQWLCNAETSGVSPEGRLRRFFDGLYAALKRGARAVLQFYPKNTSQRDMISRAAIRAGFGAGILEDDGGTKNVKTYLVLTVGGTADITTVVDGMEGVDIEDGRRRGGPPSLPTTSSTSVAAAIAAAGASAAKKKGTKSYILRKKEQMRNKGKIVKANSKYTGRRRGPKF